MSSPDEEGQHLGRTDSSTSVPYLCGCSGSLELAAPEDTALGLPRLTGAAEERKARDGTEQQDARSRGRSCSLSERDPPVEDGWNRPAVSIPPAR